MAGRVQRIAVFDTETTGLSAHHDQIVQFAGVGLDPELNIIPGDEIVLDVLMRPDVVPSPGAFAVTGISISHLMQHGIPEFEAAGHIRNWFMRQEGTNITGYNTQRFDDEVIRNTFYRNMIDPYQHEWDKGNSRSDILRLITMVFALRPEMLRWPLKDGRYSMKLGEMCRENGIRLDNAHDARFDVMATIELMRLVRKANPRLWDHFLSLGDKVQIQNLVNQRKPLAMVDPFFSREQGHLSIVLPIIYDASVKTKMYAVDLREDPTELLSLEPSEIRRRMFTKVSDLGEGEGISSIRSISTNKQPMVTELSVLRGRDDLTRRAGIDMERCLKHATMIDADKGFRERLQQAFISDFDPPEDVYEGIYSLGMIGRDEHNLRSRTRRLISIPGFEGQRPEIIATDPHELSTMQSRDRLRMFELTLRAKWANYGDEVMGYNKFTPVEIGEWVKHLDRRWFSDHNLKNCSNLERFTTALAEVKASVAMDATQEKALEELEAHVMSTVTLVDGLKSISADLQENALAEESLRTEVGIIDSDRKSREARGSSDGVDYQP